MYKTMDKETFRVFLEWCKEGLIDRPIGGNFIDFLNDARKWGIDKISLKEVTCVSCGKQVYAEALGQLRSEGWATKEGKEIEIDTFLQGELICPKCRGNKVVHDPTYDVENRSPGVGEGTFDSWGQQVS